MNTKRITFLSFLLFSILISCTDKDDDSISKSGVNPITPTDLELITTVQLFIADTTATTIDTVEFKDADGQGGAAPLIDTIFLNTAKSYQVNVTFLDESDPNDVEDITLEILAEADEHLVCFEASNAMAISINLTDSDGTYPIGLESDWMSLTAMNGTLKLTLKHQPSVKNGTCEPGETDVEVVFPLVIR